MLVDIIEVLPYDVLLRILQHTEYGELHALGLLCRRLNLLAYDVFLNRQGYYSYGTFDLPPDRTTISVLRLAFFASLPSIANFSCELTHELDDSKGFSWDFRQLLDLFTPRPTSFGRALHAIESVYIYSTTTIDTEKLFRVVIANCKACKAITISQSANSWSYRSEIPIGRHIYNEDRDFPKLLEKGELGHLFTTKPFTHQPQYKFWVRFKKQRFVLECLRLYGSEKPLSETISQVLEHLHSVRELRLPYLPKLWDSAWSGTLSIIAAAALSLRRLDLDAMGISPSDLVQFLADIPKLESLSINSYSKVDHLHYMWHDSERVSERRLTLHSLRHLSCPPACAATISMHKLPRLGTIHIILCEHDGTLFTYQTQKIVAKIVYNLKMQAHKRATVLHLEVAFPFISPAMNQMTRDIDGYYLSYAGHSTIQENPFSAFTELDVKNVVPLEQNQHVPYGIFLQVLTQWLRLFKAVRYVNFSSYYKKSGSPPVYPVLREIHMLCRSVQTVTFCQEAYDVKHVLSENESTDQGQHTQVTTIGDLNQDVLQLVFEFLDTNELYPLSCLCHNLRDWVLPIYLRRRGFSDPATETNIHLNYNDLDRLTDISAITLSSIATISNLSVFIEPQVSRFLVFEVLHRILRLVRKCSSIGTVMLGLGSPGYGIADGYCISEHSRVVWTELLIFVLCALLERSRHVSVWGCGDFGYLTFSHRDLMHNAHHHLPGGLKFPLRHELLGLEIGEDSLNLPVVRDCIIDGLGQSENITSITFLRVSSLASSSFSTMITAFPRIADLSISGSGILPEDILSALCLLPVLRGLTINGCQWYWSGQQEACPLVVDGPVPDLKYLWGLRTSIEYANFLLTHGNGLAQLGHLTISFWHPISMAPWADPFAIFDSLSNIIRLLKSRPTPLLSLRLNICLSTITALAPDGMGDFHLNDGIAHSTTGIILRQDPTSPTLDVAHTPSQIGPILRWWLGLFPDLRTLEFEEITDFIGLDDLLHNHLHIVDTCHDMEILIVNGLERSIR